jgi:peptidoglycan/xylan/chitin deacetylase (PgdA/CDA1 family)
MSDRSGAAFAKRAIATALDRAGLLGADLAARGPRVVLAVNYHATPERLAARLAEHFAFYEERFECLGEEDVLAFLRGARPLRRPGIVVCFDDGLRNQALVAAPLLEAAGLRGWFMVPGAFLDACEADQPAFFRRHIDPRAGSEPDAGLRAMTWLEARGLVARGHAIGCHTWSHTPLGPELSASVVEDEVIGGRLRLEERLGAPARTFCWPRGRVVDHSPSAQRVIARAYELAFTGMSRAVRPGDSPHRLYRFHVDASLSLPAVRFQISRFNEAWFWPRRRRVDGMLG